MKDDLRRNYPLGLLAVPREAIARVHGSSGTTGRPTFVAYTKKRPRDLVRARRALPRRGRRSAPSTSSTSRSAMACSPAASACTTGSSGSARRVVPAAGGNTPRQVMLIQDLGAECSSARRRYALHIAEVARAEGFDPATCRCASATSAASRGPRRCASRSRRELGILAFNNYGLSEVIGPGVSGECGARAGMHVQEDHFIVECIDPETLEPVPEGETGELVFTTLTKEALPVLRYRTRDLASLDRRPCPCGRTGVRMSRVVGRSDDMLIIRGVNVFPSQVEEALLRVEGTAPHYLIEVSRPGDARRGRS